MDPVREGERTALPAPPRPVEIYRFDEGERARSGQVRSGQVGLYGME